MVERPEYKNRGRADGNGRTGRMVMNYLLLYLEHPPIIIHEEDRKEYYKGLEAFFAFSR